MSKTYASAMRCVMCRRPLARAAALKSGQPVGRACAIKARLINPRPRAKAATDGAGQVRDTLTIDLFPEPA